MLLLLMMMMWLSSWTCDLQQNSITDILISWFD